MVVVSLYCSGRFLNLQVSFSNLEIDSSGLDFYLDTSFLFKNSTLGQILFPRDADKVHKGTIFYRHYKWLHQMRKDLVLKVLPNIGFGFFV